MVMGRPIKEEMNRVNYDKKNDRWLARYYTLDPETGEKKRKSKYFKKQDEAKNFLKNLKYQKESTFFDEREGIPLNVLIRFLIERKYKLGLIGDNQYCRLDRTLRRLQLWKSAGKSIDTITSDEIQDFLNSLRDYSNSYITKELELIKSAFNFAMNRGYISRNPLVDVIKPKSKVRDKVIRAMTLEEQGMFTNYLKSIPIAVEPYKNVFLIQLYMGLRVGEALALTKDDIDLLKSKIHVRRTVTKDKEQKMVMGDTTKTYSGMRDIPIPNFIRDEIIEQLEIAENHKDNLLFTTSRNGLVNPNNINNRLKRILSVMGITGITTHSLRHTFGTRCVESGMRGVAVQRLLGHKDIAVTMNTYTTIFDQYKERELELLNNYYLDNSVIDEKVVPMLNQSNEEQEK